jgi:hypothetical protein
LARNENAAWHDQRARIWGEIAENQDSLGDLASAQEPMAEFLAGMHGNQKKKHLRQAQSLRQATEQLKMRARGYSSGRRIELAAAASSNE